MHVDKPKLFMITDVLLIKDDKANQFNLHQIFFPTVVFHKNDISFHLHWLSATCLSSWRQN